MQIPKADNKTKITLNKNLNKNDDGTIGSIALSCSIDHFKKMVDTDAFTEEGFLTRAMHSEITVVITHRNPQTNQIWEQLKAWLDFQLNG